MVRSSEYDVAVDKGTNLLRMLRADDTTSPGSLRSVCSTTESLFTCAQDLEAYGYIGAQSTSCKENGIEVLYRLTSALEGIGANSNMACNGGENYVVTHKHSHATTIDGTEYPATHAELTQLCNHKDGVLIAHSNHSAPHIGRLQDPPVFKTPPLHHWSDIAYLQWLTTSTFTSDTPPVVTSAPGPIKYIFRLSIQNVKTYSVLNEVMAKHGLLTYAVWLGMTFDIDSEQGRAILGTPNGAGTAWLLIQHRRELGHRKIEKVTVFYAENEGGVYRWPSLLFWIV